MVKKWEQFKNTATGKLYEVRKVKHSMVVLELESGEGEILLNKDDLKSNYETTKKAKALKILRIIVSVICITLVILGIYCFYLFFSTSPGGSVFDPRTPWGPYHFHPLIGFGCLYIAVVVCVSYLGIVWLIRLHSWIRRRLRRKKHILKTGNP
jgi:hypothetical protein